jgi:uncharacterized protein
MIMRNVRSVLATLVVLGLSCAALPSRILAQSAVLPEARQAADELFALLSTEMLGQMSTQMMGPMWTAIEREFGPKLDPATMSDLRRELEQMMVSEVAEMMKEAPAIYSRHFTAQELRDVAAFYRTPTGQKTLRAMPQIGAEIMALLIPRMPEMQARTQQGFERILRQRGYMK